MLCSILNKTNIYQSEYEKNVIKLNFQLSNLIQHKYKCSSCLFTFATFQLSIVRDLSWGKLELHVIVKNSKILSFRGSESNLGLEVP